HQRRTASPRARREIAQARDPAMTRLNHLVARRALLELTLDMESVVVRAVELSASHTERLGVRAIDLLHVATALTLKSELFLTSDARQAQLARAEGLRTQ